MRFQLPLLREGVMTPPLLRGSSQLHFWVPMLRLCRQRLFYKDAGAEEQVHPLARGMQVAARQLTRQITLQKAWEFSAFVLLLRAGPPTYGRNLVRARLGGSAFRPAERACPQSVRQALLPRLHQLRQQVLRKEIRAGCTCVCWEDQG